MERELSFVVYDRNTDRIIGTALNFDARAEPEVDIKSKLITIFEFLEFCEGPIRYGTRFAFNYVDLQTNPL